MKITLQKIETSIKLQSNVGGHVSSVNKKRNNGKSPEVVVMIEAKLATNSLSGP